MLYRSRHEPKGKVWYFPFWGALSIFHLSDKLQDASLCTHTNKLNVIWTCWESPLQTHILGFVSLKLGAPAASLWVKPSIWGTGVNAQPFINYYSCLSCVPFTRSDHKDESRGKIWERTQKRPWNFNHFSDRVLKVCLSLCVFLGVFLSVTVPICIAC